MLLAPSASAARSAAKVHPERFPVGAEIVRIADRAVLGYVVGNEEPPDDSRPARRLAASPGLSSGGPSGALMMPAALGVLFAQEPTPDDVPSAWEGVVLPMVQRVALECVVLRGPTSLSEVDYHMRDWLEANTVDASGVLEKVTGLGLVRRDGEMYVPTPLGVSVSRRQWGSYQSILPDQAAPGDADVVVKPTGSAWSEFDPKPREEATELEELAARDEEA